MRSNLKLKFSFKKLIQILAAVSAFGCASRQPLPQNPYSAVLSQDQIRLEHLIQLQFQGQKLRFRGFFIKQGTDFMILALGDFDRPLFSLKLKSGEMSYQIYLDQLKEKTGDFDFTNVGKDVYRIYFASPHTPPPDFLKEQWDSLSETQDLKGYLTQKKFFLNQEELIQIAYSDYQDFSGVILPGRIEFRHLKYGYTLKVITLSAQPGYQPEKPF